MNAEAITLKILEDARAQAAQVLRDAHQRADELQAQGDAQIEARRLESEAQAEKQADELRDRMLRMAELDQKKALLAAKREVIDQAFEDAGRRMEEMDGAAKKAFMEKLLLGSAEGGEEIIPDEKDRGLFDAAYMAHLNDALEKAGKEGVTLSPKSRDLGGGFVLKKGGLEINCAFDAVLRQMRPTLEAEVASVLFD